MKEFTNSANIHIKRYDDQKHQELYDKIVYNNQPVVQVVQEENCPEGNQLIDKLNQLYQNFEQASDAPHRHQYYREISNHITDMIEWKKAYIETKAEARRQQQQAALLQSKEDERKIGEQNQLAHQEFDETIKDMEAIIESRYSSLLNKFHADMRQYEDCMDFDERLRLYLSIQKQIRYMQDIVWNHQQFKIQQTLINQVINMAKPFRNKVLVNTTIKILNEKIEKWKTAPVSDKFAIHQDIDEQRKELLDLIQRLQAKQLQDALDNLDKYRYDEDDDHDYDNQPINPYIAAMKTPSPPRSRNNNNNNNTGDIKIKSITS